MSKIKSNRRRKPTNAQKKSNRTKNKTTFYGIQTQVSQVSCHYRNYNQQLGMSILLNSEAVNLDNFLNSLEHNLTIYDEWKRAEGEQSILTDIYGQLNAAARPVDAVGQPIDGPPFKTDHLTTSDISVIFNNINWLERRGYLKPDEFNGMWIAHQSVG